MSSPESTARGSQAVEPKTICVVGLGYVGLPLATAFDRAGHPVYGYDVSEEKVAALNGGWDPTDEVGDAAISASDMECSTDPAIIAEADVVLIAVPTPVSEDNLPNLSYLEMAGETVGAYMTEETTVVLESTVFPGATRKVLVPAIEAASGYSLGDEFAVGYSPERLVPGDEEHSLETVVKIVSGSDEQTRDELVDLYSGVVEAGIHPAPAMEVAEAAKCIENIQRDVNIALVNELAIVCDQLGIDTAEVLEAAGTKWNFHDEYRPGLVGGHCIPVDPYFLLHESHRNGFNPQLIETAREVNEYVPQHVAEKTIKALNQAGKVLKESRVLVLGLTYKPNVEDIRTSAIDGTIEKLHEFDIEVVGYDPQADNDEMREQFGIEVQSELSFGGFDGIIVGTAHSEFSHIDPVQAIGAMNESPVVLDADGSIPDRTVANIERVLGVSIESL